MDITGTVHKILPEEKVTEKFTKKEFVIKTTDQYNPFIILQTSGAKMSILDGLKPGENVTVSINIGGREASNGKYYNTISAWKIQRKDRATNLEVYTPEILPNEPDKDLPF